MPTTDVRPWWLLPPGRVHPSWWMAVAILILWVEYLFGLYAQFPAVYVIPVSLAAWYSGRRPALMLAIFIPLAHLALLVNAGTGDRTPASLIAMTIFRGGVIAIMALWFARLSEHERELESEVETLKGLLRICAFCKSIQNDTGDWERLERFISRRSATEFSHGLCPSCLETHYPTLHTQDGGLRGGAGSSLSDAGRDQ